MRFLHTNMYTCRLYINIQVQTQLSLSIQSGDDSALMPKPVRRGLDLYTILYDNFMTIKRTSKIWGSEKLDRIVLTYKYK